MHSDQSRNIAVSGIKLVCRVAADTEALSDIVTLFEKFESMYSDLPATKSQLNDMDLETIERKVHNICSIRETIKGKCADTVAIDIYVSR